MALIKSQRKAQTRMKFKDIKVGQRFITNDYTVYEKIDPVRLKDPAYSHWVMNARAEDGSGLAFFEDETVLKLY